MKVVQEHRLKTVDARYSLRTKDVGRLSNGSARRITNHLQTYERSCDSANEVSKALVGATSLG